MLSIASERARLQATADEEFYSAAADHVLLLARTAESYRRFAEEMLREKYHLVTLVANDERELADNSFKIYAVFSHTSLDLLVTLMLPLERGATSYPSLHHLFAAAIPFECEVAERLGLIAIGQAPPAPCFRHPTYPSDLYPLRRTVMTAEIAEALKSRAQAPFTDEEERLPLGSGEFELPVGPIHAGVIEPGQFRFRVSGEVIEQLDLRLGYAHKGIERLFQMGYTLEDGWRLAEHVVGDSAVAHALAYCRAIESLAGTQTPRPAELARSLCLELERLYNHMGDCAALAHDVALDLPAADMSAPRESLLRLNERLVGHRLLRGVVRPGGVLLDAPLDPGDVRSKVSRAVRDFLPPARYLLTHSGFRSRLMSVGVLTREMAESVGATGLAARASGVFRDYRRLHPTGAEAFPEVRAVLESPAPDVDLYAAVERTAGDAFARYAARVAEVELSAHLIECMLSLWDGAWKGKEYRAEVEMRGVPNFRFGLGYAEGWRGPVVYWLMKDKFGRIYRCKVCDPSSLNWPALKAAVEPHPGQTRSGRYEVLLADFPIVNKSFNLSYAGNDL